MEPDTSIDEEPGRQLRFLIRALASHAEPRLISFSFDFRNRRLHLSQVYFCYAKRPTLRS